MTLQGGLGPSLKPEALQEKPVDALVATIYGGRPGTPMPPWHRFLSESEARWIVEQLLAGFPRTPSSRRGRRDSVCRRGEPSDQSDDGLSAWLRRFHFSD